MIHKINRASIDCLHGRKWIEALCFIFEFLCVTAAAFVTHTAGFWRSQNPVLHQPRIFFRTLTISIAANVASWPLFPTLPPARSKAWSIDSQVMTPNVTGIQVSRVMLMMPAAT